MIIDFFICGIIGWVIEIIWTGVLSLIGGDFSMTARTSLIMFPIYGMAVFLKPVYNVICRFPIFFRGVIYVFCIFTVEYASGMLLKRLGVCPWDYGNAAYSIDGVIRLDYAPAWFFVGLIFEGVLTKGYKKIFKRI